MARVAVVVLGGARGPEGAAGWTSRRPASPGRRRRRPLVTFMQLTRSRATQRRSGKQSGERGDLLLDLTGSVERAATALWVAREHLGRNNLQGADDEELTELLHPDHLAYLREVRAQGMPARYQGQRERVTTRPHPRARADMGQVYVQLMKDIAKHRVLVASASHAALKHTVSSPFELVPKMLPNRSLSTEARLVHDQRQVNGGTHKDLHPPASQPTHEQIARHILWLKARYPGIKVVLAKKDVAGGFSTAVGRPTRCGAVRRGRPMEARADGIRRTRGRAQRSGGPHGDLLGVQLWVLGIAGRMDSMGTGYGRGPSKPSPCGEPERW